MEEIAKTILEVSEIKHRYIEILLGAWMAVTEIDPREAELVEVREGTKTRWYVQRRG
jgi:hypothetical protein